MKIIIIILLLKLSISYFNIKNRIIKKQIIKNNLMKTCYPNDENDKRKRRRDIIINMPYFDMTYFDMTYFDMNYFNKSVSNTSHLDIKKNFILIWDDCEECKELLQTMDKLNIKYSYIDKDLYLKNIINDDKNFINLLFYIRSLN
jgi:hypothetical protein